MTYPSPEEIQWRNIRKVVRAAADHAFGSKDDPQWGNCWLAIVHSVEARTERVHVELEPLFPPTEPPNSSFWAGIMAKAYKPGFISRRIESAGPSKLWEDVFATSYKPPPLKEEPVDYKDPKNWRD